MHCLSSVLVCLCCLMKQFSTLARTQSKEVTVRKWINFRMCLYIFFSLWWKRSAVGFILRCMKKRNFRWNKRYHIAAVMCGVQQSCFVFFCLMHYFCCFVLHKTVTDLRLRQLRMIVNLSEVYFWLLALLLCRNSYPYSVSVSVVSVSFRRRKIRSCFI